MQPLLISPFVWRSLRRDFSCDTSLRRREMPDTCADRRRITSATLSISSGSLSGVSTIRSNHTAGNDLICASSIDTRSSNCRRCRIRFSKYVWPKLVYTEKANDAKQSSHSKTLVVDGVGVGNFLVVVVWSLATMVAFSIVSLDLPPNFIFNYFYLIFSVINGTRTYTWHRTHTHTLAHWHFTISHSPVSGVLIQNAHTRTQALNYRLHSNYCVVFFFIRVDGTHGSETLTRAREEAIAHPRWSSHRHFTTVAPHFDDESSFTLRIFPSNLVEYLLSVIVTWYAAELSTNLISVRKEMQSTNYALRANTPWIILLL